MSCHQRQTNMPHEPEETPAPHDQEWAVVHLTVGEMDAIRVHAWINGKDRGEVLRQVARAKYAASDPPPTELATTAAWIDAREAIDPSPPEEPGPLRRGASCVVWRKSG